MKLKGLLLIAAPIAFFALNAHAQTTIQLKAEIGLLQAEIAALKHQVNLIASNPALALGPFVTVNSNPVNDIVGPNIVFHGVNIQLVNGMGSTGLTNGLGNLILGYGEEAKLGVDLYDWTGPADRMGSHNLMLGVYNKYESQAWGSIVGGSLNAVNGPSCFVLGGQQNRALSGRSVIISGMFNATYNGDTVIGGDGQPLEVYGQMQVLAPAIFRSGVDFESVSSTIFQAPIVVAGQTLP